MEVRKEEEGFGVWLWKKLKMVVTVEETEMGKREKDEFFSKEESGRCAMWTSLSVRFSMI